MRLRKDFGQFGIFFDGCPMLTNSVEAVSQGVMVCEDTRCSFTFLFFFVLKKTAPGDAMSFAKTLLDNTLFITPSFQMIIKLTQSFFQRFVGGANSPDSKSLTVWYAPSHTRMITAARQNALIGVGRFGVGKKW